MCVEGVQEDIEVYTRQEYCSKRNADCKMFLLLLTEIGTLVPV